MRPLGKVLIALVTLVGSQAYGQFDFTKSMDIAWDEQHGLEGATGGTSLDNLNSRVDDALSDATDATLCYVLSGTPTNALTFNSAAPSCSVPGKSGKRSQSGNWLVLKSGQHIDYERGAKQLLTITGYDAQGVAKGKFEVTLNVTNYDERPFLVQPSSQQKIQYWRPDDSMRLLVSDLFRDPERAPVRFDPSASSTDVWICDTADAADFTINEAPDVPTRSAGPGSALTFTGGDGAANCSVSNAADPSASPAPDPNPGERGSAGNRVLSAKVTGPFLEIKADSLADDTDADGTVTDRGSGTYAAKVYVRAWSGPSDPPLSSTGFAFVNVLVKVGENNPPQFAGGATGFSVTLTEGNDETDPMPAWVAGDLDVGGTTNDSLTYSLNPTGSKSVSIAGGSIALKEIRGDNPATTATETNFLVALALMGRGLNYESRQTSFEIGLYVTDTWSAPVRVPIQVTLLDVNELVIKRPIDDVRLINGLSTEIDLTEFYSDPEGDEITYEVYTNQYTDVAVVDNVKDTLTIHGKYAKKGEGGESMVRVTLIATDSKGLEAVPLEFDVTTRFENQKPSITIRDQGTLAIGANVFEADSAGVVLMPLIAYTDDEPAPKAVFNGEPMFRAIIDPYLKEGEICSRGSSGCVHEQGKVAIVVGSQDLNFEARPKHNLTLALQDAWQPEIVSESIEFQVSVNDSNDAPTVVTGSQIEDQTIVVNGSATYEAGKHFTDEDGDRLRVNAVSNNKHVVEVEVVELDHVVMKGIKEGSARITLTAVDPEGASVDLSFQVKVGPNNPPIVVEEEVASQLPENNVLGVAALAEIELDRMFSEPDSGDTITSITATSSDESTLLVIPTDEGQTTTLVGRSSGTATLTITAMDQGGNVTSIVNEIIVNASPEEAMPLDAVTLDRNTPLDVDLSGVFSDADHSADELVISADVIGDDVNRVTLVVTGTQLTITGVMGASPGDVEIQLTATDPHGFSATSVFVATVVNIGPMVAMAIEPQELDRIEPLVLDLSAVFEDADGEITSIAATVAEEGIVATSEITENGTLTVTGLAVGSTSITLTATDDNDAYTMVEFDVTVINIEPVVVERIPEQSTTRAENLVLDIGGTFNDPDASNDLMTYAVAVQDETYVRASLDGTTLTLAGLDVGVTRVTLKATDADDGKAETSFSTTIENVDPVAIGSLPAINLEVGGQALTQSIAGLFMDDDPLSYAVSVADSSVAQATLIGTSATIAPASRGSTTLVVTALDPHGARATVSGTVTVSDGELKAVAAKSLASFGRAMIASVSASVGSRMTIGERSHDQTIDAWAPIKYDDAPSSLIADEQFVGSLDVFNGSQHGLPAGSARINPIASIRSMVGQKFALNLGTSEKPSPWAVWGSMDAQSYEGDGYDGMASSVYLGADVTVAECWIIGVAVSGNSGESDYSWGSATQTMNLSVTTLLPYLSYQPTDRTQFWGVAGFGSGELDTTVVGASDDSSFLDSTLTMLGASQKLKSVGRFNLTLRGDAASVALETDEGTDAADGLSTNVNRIRIGLEGSMLTDTGQGGMLEPFGQLNLRSDGGDGDTSTGVEIVGGVRVSGPSFSIEARGRTLANYGVDGYSESGFSLMAKLNPAGNGTGFSLSVTPRWGEDAQGTNILWHDTLDLRSIQANSRVAGLGNTSATKSIDAQIAYGLFIANEMFLLTPYVDTSFGDFNYREIRIGANLTRLQHDGRRLDVNLALGRVEDRFGANTVKIGLNTTLSF